MGTRVNAVMKREIGTWIVKERFTSRKNEVYLIDLKREDGEILTCVLKKYMDRRESKSKEAFLLKALGENGLNVPKIYFEGNDYLLLEYIKGKTLLDKLSYMERNQGENIKDESNQIVFLKLFKWFQNLYTISKKVLGRDYIFGDINFRNFIVNNKIYGIDLEDCSCTGYKEMDGGRFCAYLLTYTPAFTKWKLAATKQAVEIMTRRFDYDEELLKEEIKKELIEIQRRRKIELPDGIMERVLDF